MPTEVVHTPNKKIKIITPKAPKKKNCFCVQKNNLIVKRLKF